MPLCFINFLLRNRSDLIERCRVKVTQRHAPKVTKKELEHGIPLFLDQLTGTLQIEQSADPMQSRKVSGPSGGGAHHASEMGEAAGRHGRDLMKEGFTVDQVVHDYGDVCQAITDLAFELKVPIEIDEFRTLNRCLDNGIADAVTEYNYQRDFMVEVTQVNAWNKKLGFFAHELRNELNSATLALHALKSGNVGLAGATGSVLENSLAGMRNLINGSLTEVRIKAGLPSLHQRFSLSEFITEVKHAAVLDANARECYLTVADVDPALVVDADRDLLSSAVANLLQNAFKFTQHRTEVRLNAYAFEDRIRIDVLDHCGGLPAGAQEKMFEAFTQNSDDKSGLGLWPVDRPEQRGGKPGNPERARYPRHRMCVHHRPAAFLKEAGCVGNILATGVVRFPFRTLSRETGKRSRFTEEKLETRAAGKRRWWKRSGGA